jgi:amidase
MEPCFLTASQAARLYETGELTVTEVVTSTLARIKARDELVKGWAYLDEELVMKRARDLDSIPKAQRGPLHGITIAVKDVIYTKGMSPGHHQYCLLTASRHADSTQLADVQGVLP